MNEQPEQPAQEPAGQPDSDLQFLNAELDKLIEQEKAKQGQAENAAKDNNGQPRLASVALSHDEIHALGTAVKMLFQFCSMALIQGNNSKDESQEWKDRIETLLGVKDQLLEQHKATYDNEPCDDDDDNDNCDHDH